MASSQTNPASGPSGAPPPLKIEKLVHGGLGLARWEGRVVLAPFVLPGETVRLRIAGRRPGRLLGRLEEIREPAAGRVAPPCPYFQSCGGCMLQHADYALQLELKRAILAESLRRIGKISPPEEIAAIAGPPWDYRNRVQFHLDGRRIGFFQPGSHRLCPVARCLIASPAVNRTLAALTEMLPDARFPRFLRSLEVFTNERQVQLNVTAAAGGRAVARRFFQWCAERIPGVAEGALDYETGGETYRVGYRSFFQVNRFLIEPLVACALQDAQGETALDLYAGVGLFSLPLARRFHRVTAVEAGGGAARDLEFNAARAGRPIRVERSAAERYLAGLKAPPDFVLADPPRAGLGRQATAELLRLKPPRLTIVSCDPATLARDLGALSAGGYRLERLALVDLFPQTHHLEAVAALVAGTHLHTLVDTM